MSLFDKIVKSVNDTIEPGLESLVNTEIDGMAVNDDSFDEDATMLEDAMEALGVDTVYAEEELPDDLSKEEIEALSKAGASEEDEEDYEDDDESSEDLIDGYIDEVYGDEAEDALGVLSEQDLEDIEDDFSDAGFESYSTPSTGEVATEANTYQKNLKVIKKEAKDLKKNLTNISKAIANQTELVLAAQTNCKRAKKKDAVSAFDKFQAASDKLSELTETQGDWSKQYDRLRSDMEKMKAEMKTMKADMKAAKRQQVTAVDDEDIDSVQKDISEMGVEGTKNMSSLRANLESSYKLVKNQEQELANDEEPEAKPLQNKLSKFKSSLLNAITTFNEVACTYHRPGGNPTMIAMASVIEPIELDEE